MSEKNKNIVKQFHQLLQSNGFKKKSKLYYKIEDNIAFCISFQTATSLYVNFYFMPLYIPAENRYLEYGNRLEIFSKHKIPPLSFRLDEYDDETLKWVECVKLCLKNDILPFFCSINSIKKLSLYLLNKQNTEYIGCHNSLFALLRAYTFAANCQDDLARKYAKKYSEYIEQQHIFSSDNVNKQRRYNLEVLMKMLDEQFDERQKMIKKTVAETLSNCFIGKNDNNKQNNI